MILILVRHGEAEDSDPGSSWGMDDSLRPLTAKGQKQAKCAAEALSKFIAKADRVISSKLKRAEDTASFFTRRFKLPAAQSYVDFAPEGGVEKQFSTLLSFDPDSTMIIVAHQPSISALAAYLLSSRPIMPIEFQTSSMCVISFSGAPKAGQGVLRALIPPQISAAFLDS